MVPKETLNNKQVDAVLAEDDERSETMPLLAAEVLRLDAICCDLVHCDLVHCKGT